MAFKTLSVLLTANSSGLVSGLARASLSVQSFEKQTARAALNVSDAAKGINVLKIGALGLAAAVAYSVKSAADFQTKMLEVKAVSGANSAQMAQLSAKALQLGKDTVFSASDAADAIGELVKAGVSVADVMHGAADATVALAAAGGISLPQAATIAANAMNAFNIQASQLPHVADLIAGAANASAIDVGEFGLSLQQVSAMAHLAGLSFEDTTTAIALMGNAGIKGSDAGTSLKTMLQYLQPQTKQAAAEMQKLGIMTETGGNRFFDATGHIKSMATIAEVLRQSLQGLTKQQQTQALATLFGTDAVRAAAVIANNGAAGFDKLADSIGKVKAADVAKTRMSGLSGAMQNLQGSVETVAIQFGNRLLPALTSTANFAASTLVPALGGIATELFKHPDIIATVAVAYGGWKFIPPLLTTINGGLTTMRLRAMYAADTLRTLGNGSVLRGLAIGTPAAIGGFIALDEAIKGLNENLHSAQLNASAAKSALAGYSKITNIDVTDPAKYAAARQAILGFSKAESDAGKGIREVALAQAMQQSQLDKLGMRFFAAQANVTRLSDQLHISRDAVEAYARELGIDLSGNVDKAQKKLGDYINTQVAGTPATRAAAQALLNEAGGAETAAQKIDDLTNSMNSLAGANATMFGGQLAVNAAILNLKDNLAQGSTELNQNTAAGVQNEQAVLGVANAINQQAQNMAQQGKTLPEITAYVNQQKEAFIQQAKAAGLNEGQVRFLINTLTQLPPEKHTNVSTPGAATSQGQVAALKHALDTLGTIKRVTFLSSGVPDVIGDVSRINAALATIGNSYVVNVGQYGTGRKLIPGAATGMLIGGSGGPRQDNHLIRVSTGETVVPAHLTPKYAPYFAADGIPGFASGGIPVPAPQIPGSGRSFIGGTNITITPNVRVDISGAGADSPEIRTAIRRGVAEGFAEVVDMIDQRVGGRK